VEKSIIEYNVEIMAFSITKGTTVLYKSSQSQGLIGVARVLILDVHTDDDLVPYYSIKLPDGREKQ